MIFEKLPAVRLLPRYVSVVVNVFCAAVARSFSIFDIDYGVDDGDLSISLHLPLPPREEDSSQRWSWCCVRDLHRRLWMTFLIAKGVHG